jgi:hypothetical protein
MYQPHPSISQSAGPERSSAREQRMHVRTFPRRRLVKCCTKRFRGNQRKRKFVKR